MIIERENRLRVVRLDLETCAYKRGQRMTFGLYLGPPFETVAALLGAVTRYATCYS